MAKKSKVQQNRFKEAVISTPDIKNCYQIGLGALGKYSTKISSQIPCQGSVDIDACVTAKYPNANRWDYTIGYNNQAYFVEVHSANTSEVTVVLKKLAWLKTWLSTQAPELNKIKAKTNPFIWIMSGNYNILKGSSHHRRIIQAGLNPKSILTIS